MKQDLSDKRVDYKQSEINFQSILADPMQMFANWYDEVQKSGAIAEPYAMHLSTVGVDGYPRSRVVLLKEFNELGYVFYTNYNSQKGKAIAKDPRVCLSFFWDKLERQVIIKGLAEKLSHGQSEEYFNKRPFESQIGAIVSDQSSVIGFETDLSAESKILQEEYKHRKICMPGHWGGYLVKALEIEFWQGRPGRLHDRLRYKLESGRWLTERLAP